MFNILTNELRMRYGIIQSGIWKREIYTNIVIKCGNIGITKEEMDNLLFMNEPITLRQIDSVFRIFTSKNMSPDFTRMI